MDQAIAELESTASPCITVTARKFGVGRTTLYRRWKGITNTKAHAIEDTRLLTPEQEDQLVQYIRVLSERCFPPTPAMITGFAASMSGRTPGSHWCTRFVERHKVILDSRYLNNLDLERHDAESLSSFQQYFDVVEKKIQEYGILPENIYNMDERGFLLGRVVKAKRVFTRELHASGQLLGAGQDGSREWITVVGTVCGDLTALSTLLIYDSSTSTLQDTWLQDFDPEEHEAWFTSSPTGWTSKEVAIKWLQQLFEKETATKARRHWRLLFLDGHGSHITMKFIDWAQDYRILLAVYPPHSTHRLQPLDVSCFSPLAIYYSQQLEKSTRMAEGITRMTKRDFFRCFYPAWHQAFTRSNIASSWSKTGIIPWNPTTVLKKLKQPFSQKLRPRRGQSNSPPLC